METIKDHRQPKEKGGEQKIILDPAITAETDELDPKFREDENNPDIIRRENNASH